MGRKVFARVKGSPSLPDGALVQLLSVGDHSVLVRARDNRVVAIDPRRLEVAR